METCMKKLEENPSDVFLGAAKILVECAYKILHNPEDMKYRRLRIVDIQDELLPVSGAFECLFFAGFEEDGEYLTLPKTTALDKLKKLHQALADKVKMSFSKPTQTSSKAGERQFVSPQSESEFYNQLLGHVQQVRNYVRPGVLERARSYIPLAQLKKTAEENLRRLGADGCSVNDLLLIELLAWFKEFFKWMDSPSCSACGGQTVSQGHVPPTSQELGYQAQRVENYICASSHCGVFTRFPRYNDPIRLFETRAGRCGEWANCFTLCCLAAGLEARYVVDWSDHVWTEIYSTTSSRWIHADPCENVCDKPLLYEAGWGKKLSYVIAFSPEDIQDVTWRYTSHPDEVLRRRTLCREGWLVHMLVTIRQQLQDRLTAQRRATLTTRTLVELVELMTPNTASIEGLGGRTTGSLQWRLSRGELGSENFVPQVIRPTREEIDKQLLEVKYSCSDNKYFRPHSKADSVVTDGWQKLAFEVQDISRKVENDWKMVYLARSEGTDVGSITWKIDLGSNGMCVDRLEVKVSDACFENGKVRWTICSNEKCIPIAGGEMRSITDLSGCAEFSLKAYLQGGTGQNAWQHTQLFRQKLGETKEFPLHIRVHLRHC